MKTERVPVSVLRFIDAVYEFGFTPEGLDQMGSRLSTKLLQYLAWLEDGTAPSFSYFGDGEVDGCINEQAITETYLWEMIKDLLDLNHKGGGAYD